MPHFRFLIHSQPPEVRVHVSQWRWIIQCILTLLGKVKIYWIQSGFGQIYIHYLCLSFFKLLASIYGNDLDFPGEGLQCSEAMASLVLQGEVLLYDTQGWFPLLYHLCSATASGSTSNFGYTTALPHLYLSSFQQQQMKSNFNKL